MKISGYFKKMEDSVNARLDKLNAKCGGKKIFTFKASALVVTGLVVLSGAGIVHGQTTAYEVLHNGQCIGYVKDQATFEEAMQKVEDELCQAYQHDNVIIADEIELKPTRTFDKKLDASACADLLDNDVKEVKLAGAVIKINGEDRITADSKETADKALEAFKSAYTQVEGATLLESAIKEPVEVVEAEVDINTAQSYDNVLSYLQTGNAVVTPYVVQEGETSGALVAANRGIGVDRLAELNAGRDMNTLNAGDTVNIEEKKPVLTVVTKAERQYQEPIAFETEEQPTEELYEGETQEVQKGEDGVKDVDAVFTYENGQEVGREVKSENVSKEPVKAIVQVGTKQQPISMPSISGSGQFLIPTSGHIGEIGRPGGGSSNHTNGCAVDILNGYGTPVYASAAGTVTRAGWYGGYGNCIEIQHADGYSTLYGHLSSINVSVGQSVGQGEYIGGTGSTGSSTANHLHFEIKYNGEAQYIVNYLSIASGMDV
ncbi:MAG: peptidoglycan DD-metalloendopeptidase family protein [Eubacterium sp.]|nr:peptidoglycan DD-metalloendopeptidase family protein [Eubacterium sp.]